MSLFKSATSTSLVPPELPDVEVANPPSDSVSSLAFSSAANFLAAGSWDNNVRTAGALCSEAEVVSVIGTNLRDK